MSNAAIMAACAAASSLVAAQRSSVSTSASEQHGTVYSKPFKPRNESKRKEYANKRRALVAQFRQEV